MDRGNLQMIIGNMFAGKTSELIQRIEVMRRFGKKRVIIFKPKIDTRSGDGRIKSFHKNFLEAIDVQIDNSDSLFSLIKSEESKQGHRFDVIAIDEVQFLPNVYHIIDSLLMSGYDVICAGLRLDFKGEPFGETLSLIGLCTGMHNVTLLHSFCSKCGKPAHLPQRLVNKKPVSYNSDQVQVGGKESYEARCYDCHELPGKPGL